MKPVRLLLVIIPLLLLPLFLLINSCGRNRDDAAQEKTLAAQVSGTGMTGLYISGAPSDYRQALVTLEQAELVNAGTGSACSLLSVPATVDIAAIGAGGQLEGLAECPAGPYDIVRVELNKSVQIMSAPTGTPSVSFCSLASYTDQAGVQHAFACAGPICAIEIPARIELRPFRDNRIVLHLSKLVLESAAGTGTTPVNLNATAAAAVRPLLPEAVTGLVSDLSGTNRAFRLARGNSLFTVDYSGLPAGRLSGVTTLLQLAEANALRVKIISRDIKLTGETMTAGDIQVKIEGVCANMQPGEPLLLTFREAASAADLNTVSVDYSNAATAGLPADSGWVIARIYGHDGVNYLASRVLVEPSGMSGDD